MWISFNLIEYSTFLITPALYIDCLIKDQYFSVGITWLIFDINIGVEWN